MIGSKFGKLTVTAKLHARRGHSFWRCECECGKVREIREDALKRGQQSCGCLMGKASRHGHCVNDESSLTYKTWISMRERCNNPSNASYIAYGARGVTVCARWDSFEAFLEDMGERPSTDYSIDRINNDGNYEPGNCRWATRSEQCANRRSTRWLEFNGERLPQVEWARRCGFTGSALRARLMKGWTLQDALTIPKKSTP